MNELMKLPVLENLPAIKRTQLTPLIDSRYEEGIDALARVQFNDYL